MAFCEGYHRRLSNDPHLTEEEHNELKTAMLNAIPRSRKNLYEPALKRAHLQTQRQRLEFLIARAADVNGYFDDSKKPRLHNELVDTRNDITHQNQPVEDVLPLAQLYDRVERLVQVIEVNLLLDLGVPENRIGDLVKGAHARRPRPAADPD